MKFDLYINDKIRSYFTHSLIRNFHKALFQTDSEGGFSATKDGYTFKILFMPYEKQVEKTPPVEKKWKKAVISIVIDDCGYSVDLAEKLAAIDFPLTFAIIPYTPHLKETANIARKAGKPIFLHQPMQPLSYPKTDPGKGAILVNMPKKFIEATLKANLENIGNIDGFNNHMGSAATEDRRIMEDVMTYMKPKVNVFLDSHTSRKTVASLNTTYLDNKNEPEYIKSQLLNCVERAEKNGQCIIIGHLRPQTVAVLAAELPKLEAEGVKIASILDLAK